MQTVSNNRFRQHLQASAREKSFPLRAMFELTYRCNFKCSHCYVPFRYRGKRELATREVFCILDQLRDIGCFYLGFTGGEPFVRKDILDILWHAKRCGFEIIIYTNGSLITDKIAKELTAIRPNKIDITLPALSRKAFERITKAKGSRDKVFRAINILYRSGLNLGFKSCLLKENEDEIKEIKNFASSLGCLHRLDNTLSARLDGSRIPFRFRGKLKLKQQPLFRKPSRVSYGYYRENPLECGSGINQVAVTPLGELKMCVMIDYPKCKIRDTSLKSAWEGLKKFLRGLGKIPEECRMCNLKPYCKICPVKLWLDNNCARVCDAEIRNLAKMKRFAYEDNR